MRLAGGYGAGTGQQSIGAYYKGLILVGIGFRGMLPHIEEKTGINFKLLPTFIYPGLPGLGTRAFMKVQQLGALPLGLANPLRLQSLEKHDTQNLTNL